MTVSVVAVVNETVAATDNNSKSAIHIVTVCICAAPVPMSGPQAELL